MLPEYAGYSAGRLTGDPVFGAAGRDEAAANTAVLAAADGRRPAPLPHLPPQYREARQAGPAAAAGRASEHLSGFLTDGDGGANHGLARTNHHQVRYTHPSVRVTVPTYV